MMVLTFRDVSKFASVNPATDALILDGFVIFYAKVRRQSICDEPRSCISLMYILCAKYFSSHVELN